MKTLSVGTFHVFIVFVFRGQGNGVESHYSVVDASEGNVLVAVEHAVFEMSSSYSLISSYGSANIVKADFTEDLTLAGSHNTIDDYKTQTLLGGRWGFKLLFNCICNNHFIIK